MSDIWDIDDFYDDSYDPEPVTCKHCGETDLWWLEKKRGKFILIDDDGKMHDCPQFNTPTKCNFPKVEE